MEYAAFNNSTSSCGVVSATKPGSARRSQSSLTSAAAARPNARHAPDAHHEVSPVRYAGARVMPGVRGLAVCLDEGYTENFDPGVNFSRNYSY
jgi:hypothetical protein